MEHGCALVPVTRIPYCLGILLFRTSSTVIIPFSALIIFSKKFYLKGAVQHGIYGEISQQSLRHVSQKWICLSKERLKRVRSIILQNMQDDFN